MRECIKGIFTECIESFCSVGCERHLDENSFMIDGITYKKNNKLYLYFDFDKQKYRVIMNGKFIKETEDWCEAIKIFRSEQRKREFQDKEINKNERY